MSLWRELIREVHRRSLWQVLGIYLAAGWIVLQVVLALDEAIGLPEWAPPATVVLLLIGLPVVIVTAFVQEGGPTRELFRMRAANVDPTLLPEFEASDVADRTFDAMHLTGVRRHLTWRRSLSGGVAAFALLALATTGFMVIRHRGSLLAQGVLAESDRIVLADFATRNVDAELAAVLTEALRIDLLQSNVVRLPEPAAIAQALQRMEQKPDATLTTELALHAAEREGWKAVISADVGGVGGRYVLSAQLLATEGATVLGVFKATASDSTELLDAVAELSQQLRGKVGESLKALRASPPLERVTTSSLAALRKYVEGSRAYLEAGERARAIELLDEAIALDSTFAMAWRRKGVFLNNLQIRPEERNHALTRAYELSERLPEKERLLATAAYLGTVKSDTDAAIAAYRRVLELDSLDGVALNNLSLQYNNAGRWAEAAPLLERALRAGGGTETQFMNLISAKFRLGQREEAQAVMRDALAALPNNPNIQRARALFAASEMRWAEADSIARAVGEQFRDNVTFRATALNDRVNLALLHGRLSELPGLIKDLQGPLKAFPTLRLAVTLNLAEASLRIRRDAPRGLRELDEALRLVPLDSIPVSEQPLPRLAELYADAGRFDIAEQYMQRIIAGHPRRENAPGALFAGAYIAMLRGDGAAVLELHRETPPNCPTCNRHLVGRGYELLGQPDSALAAYEAFLTARQWSRLNAELKWRPLVLVRTAELHEAAGNVARARELYSEFIRLWEHADPELQPRVAAAKNALARLTADRR